MEAYTGFAGVYDIFMEDTPYEAWADFLSDLIEKYGISKPIREKEDTLVKEGSRQKKDGLEALEEMVSERDRKSVV